MSNSSSSAYKLDSPEILIFGHKSKSKNPKNGQNPIMSGVWDGRKFQKKIKILVFSCVSNHNEWDKNYTESLESFVRKMKEPNVGTFLRDKVLGFSKNVLTFVGTFFGGDIEQDSEVSPTAS